jgi:diguanylate cyclase (GGDEF)-like protein
MSNKIETLKQELAKKVGVLLTIMHIHDIFSKGVQEKEIFQVILNKLKEMLSLKKITLVLIKETAEKPDCIIFPGEEDLHLDDRQFKTITHLREQLILDNVHDDENFSSLKDTLTLKNIFINPLHMGEDLKGFLIGGNQLDNFVFSKEDLDLIDILSKNIVLIWEHKRLSRAVENLEILDPLTGLYNKKHIKVRLEEEIKRAVMYQRPCGLLLVEASNLKELQDKFGIIEAEKTLKKTAKIFKDSLRPIDISDRVEENKLVAILIERNKRQCQKVAENIKNVLEEHFKQEHFKINFIFSVAENPIDGRTAQELFNYAFANLRKKNEISQENN